MTSDSKAHNGSHNGELQVDRVFIHPHHGLIKVTRLCERDGPEGVAPHVEFIQIPRASVAEHAVFCPLTIVMPVGRVEDAGIRPPLDPDELDDLLDVFNRPPPAVAQIFGRRFKNYQEAATSGDLFSLVKALHSINSRHLSGQRVSPAEAKLALEMREVLTAEVSASLGSDITAAAALLEERMTAGVGQPVAS